MSARVVAADREGIRRGALLVAGLGIGALLLRTRVLVVPGAARTAALAAIYAGLLVASIAVPMPPGSRRVPATVALAAGVAGVGIAALAAGRPVPMPFATWALALSLLAAVAEEALFRRVAYGALESRGAVVAVGLTALAFALIHVPLYGLAAFPVDLGAGLLFGWQRWAAGTWTVPAGTHAVANLLAVLLR